MKNFNQEEFNNFILENNVVGIFQEPITLKSGRISYFYVNWRDVVSDVFLIDKLTDFIINFTKDLGLNPDCFYGIPEGATKLATIIQFKLARNSYNYHAGSHVLSMGRAKPKEHGVLKDRFFIGAPKGKTIVIEDTTTTGGSLINNLKSLKESGTEIIGVITLTNRMEKRDDGLSVKEAVENLGIPFYNMSDALTLLPKLCEKTAPDENIKKSLQDYFQKYGVEELKLNNTSKIDFLLEKIDEKKTPCIIGLDPQLKYIPNFIQEKYSDEKNVLKAVADIFIEFNKSIIDATYDLVPAFKLNICFYEKYGSEGVRAFQETTKYIREKDCVVIEDAKRNEVGESSKAYAEGHLGEVDVCGNRKSKSLDVDIMVVNPYLGSDGINPFLDVCKEYGKGIFILVKTSNPSSGEFQDKFVEVNTDEKIELGKLGINIIDKTNLYNLVALKVNNYAQQIKGSKGYSFIGAVVGATYPNQAETLRKIMPNSIFLVPGYGAQGGTADDIVPCFNSDGYGAIINSSRGIIFAYKKKGFPEDKFAEAAREAIIEMIKNINSALKRNGKLPIGWSI